MQNVNIIKQNAQSISKVILVTYAYHTELENNTKDHYNSATSQNLKWKVN